MKAMSAFDRGLTALRCGDLTEARTWLERARRLEPGDASVALALGSVLTRTGDPAALPLYRQILEAWVLEEALCGLAAAQRMTGDHQGAASTRGSALSRFSSARSPTQEAALGKYCQQVAATGWCALDSPGSLTIAVLDPDFRGKLAAALDGATFWQTECREEGPARYDIELPATWHSAKRLAVSGEGVRFLGEALSIADIVRVEGIVSASEGGLSGWAWCPHDPGHAPVLTLRRAGWPPMEIRTSSDPSADIRHARPLANPRAFRVPAGLLEDGEGPVEITGRDGRQLYGSPLDPGAWQRSAAWIARKRRTAPGEHPPAMLAVPAALKGPPARGGGARAGCTILIPVHGAREITLRCLERAMATCPPWAEVLVVDDASEDAQLVAALAGLAANSRIRLLRHGENRGFPAAVNTGIETSPGRDVVLLNSDTLVPPHWLERLREAAYSAADIGTATPLSNDATLLSYPDPSGGNPVPDEAGTERLDGFAAAAGGAPLEIPTAIGFCMFARRDCLDDTGPMRADVFAQGYGEENDFCMRARHLGWRHVAAPNVFVAHVGGQSFGAARDSLRARNLGILNDLHPGYDRLVDDFRRKDTLAPSRRAIDARRWEAARDGRPAIVLVTHGRQGGVRRVVTERALALRAAGTRPILIWPGGGESRDCVLGDGPEGGTPNLRFSIPEELDDLCRLLAGDGIVGFEVHSLIGHGGGLLDLPRRLGVPYDIVVHDYAWFCPRITLTADGATYCGEPDIDACQACVEDHGDATGEAITVAELRLRSRRQLDAAATVATPSRDAAGRMARHFPGVIPSVRPWEIDPSRDGAPARRAASPDLHVVTVGAIGPEKGFHILLACVRDARRRRLAIRFTIVGYTSDDERLLAAGPAHVTGAFHESELPGLLRSQQADIGFLPSVWPETWCFALSQMWQAALPVLAFDLGAQAERLRGTGRGALLPLGSSAACINDALLSMGSTPVEA